MTDSIFQTMRTEISCNFVESPGFGNHYFGAGYPPPLYLRQRPRPEDSVLHGIFYISIDVLMHCTTSIDACGMQAGDLFLYLFQTFGALMWNLDA